MIIAITIVTASFSSLLSGGNVRDAALATQLDAVVERRRFSVLQYTTAPVDQRKQGRVDEVPNIVIRSRVPVLQSLWDACLQPVDSFLQGLLEFRTDGCVRFNHVRMIHDDWGLIGRRFGDESCLVAYLIYTPLNAGWTNIQFIRRVRL